MDETRTRKIVIEAEVLSAPDDGADEVAYEVYKGRLRILSVDGIPYPESFRRDLR